jgi:hypothetical protein
MANLAAVYYFEGFELGDCHENLSLTCDTEISINDAEVWLEADEGNPGYENYTEEQIAENVSTAEADDEEKQKSVNYYL